MVLEYLPTFLGSYIWGQCWDPYSSTMVRTWDRLTYINQYVPINVYSMIMMPYCFTNYVWFSDAHVDIETSRNIYEAGSSWDADSLTQSEDGANAGHVGV